MRKFFALIACSFSIPLFALDKITFSEVCQRGNTLTIVAVGDILLHRPLQYVGLQKGFENLWQITLPYLKAGDITYGNLEGPINATHGLGFGYPNFGYPKGLAAALKKSGFSIVSTANNHSLDQSAIGIENTIRALNAAALPYVGTKMRHEDSTFIRILNKKSFKTAWIACAMHTNGIIDYYKQVLYCDKKNDRQYILNSIKKLKSEVDVIIITPHWGEQYENYPTDHQKKFAHDVLNAGATIVLGSHPHVLQPLEKYRTLDGRDTLIVYSLGNFVSFQGNVNNRTSMLVFIDLIKNIKSTAINSVHFMPIYMENRSGFERMALNKLEDKNSSAYQIVKRYLPLQNISYTFPVLLHCQ